MKTAITTLVLASLLANPLFAADNNAHDHDAHKGHDHKEEKHDSHKGCNHAKEDAHKGHDHAKHDEHKGHDHDAHKGHDHGSHEDHDDTKGEGRNDGRMFTVGDNLAEIEFCHNKKQGTVQIYVFKKGAKEVLPIAKVPRINLTFKTARKQIKTQAIKPNADKKTAHFAVTHELLVGDINAVVSIKIDGKSYKVKLNPPEKCAHGGLKSDHKLHDNAGDHKGHKH